MLRGLPARWRRFVRIGGRGRGCGCGGRHDRRGSDNRRGRGRFSLATTHRQAAAAQRQSRPPGPVRPPARCAARRASPRRSANRTALAPTRRRDAANAVETLGPVRVRQVVESHGAARRRCVDEAQLADIDADVRMRPSGRIEEDQVARRDLVGLRSTRHGRSCRPSCAAGSRRPPGRSRSAGPLQSKPLVGVLPPQRYGTPTRLIAWIEISSWPTL